jgi:hypothetical protein
MNDSPNYNLSDSYKQIIARLLKAGWITDKNAVISDGESCGFGFELTKLGCDRMYPVSSLIKSAYPEKFIAYLRGNGGNLPAATWMEWLRSIDFQRLSKITPEIEALVAELSSPPLLPAEYSSLMHIALVFDPDSQPRVAPPR